MPCPVLPTESYRILEIISLVFGTVLLTKSSPRCGSFEMNSMSNSFQISHFLVHWPPTPNTHNFPLLILFSTFPNSFHFFFLFHYPLLFSFYFKIKSRAGEMALLIEGLVCKHEGLSLILRIYLKILVWRCASL